MTSLLSNIITLHVIIKSICNWITLMFFRFTEKDMNITACIDTATPFWEQAKHIYAESKMLTSFRSRNMKTSICISADFSVLWLQSTRYWNKHTFHNVALSHMILLKRKKMYIRIQAMFMHTGKGNIYCCTVLKKEKTNLGGSSSVKYAEAKLGP